MAENQSGDRGCNYKRERNGGHEVAGRLAAVLKDEPVAKIDDDAREKTCFGRAQQETRGVEFERGVNESGKGRNRSPDDHGQTNDAARAPSFHQQRAWNLQRHIADKENAGAQSEHPVAEAELASHSDCGVGDAGAIEIVGDIEGEKKWQQAQCGVMPSAVGDIRGDRDDDAWDGSSQSATSVESREKRGVYLNFEPARRYRKSRPRRTRLGLLDTVFKAA